MSLDQFEAEASLPPKIITCAIGSLTETSKNKPVKIGAGNVAALCADGDEIIGLCETVDNSVVGVKLAGICECTYTGSDPAIGRSKLVADGAGTVKVDGGSSHPSLLVIAVDTTNKLVTFILNTA